MDDNSEDRLKKIFVAPEQNGLLRLLKGFEELFDGALETFNMELSSVES